LAAPCGKLLLLSSGASNQLTRPGPLNRANHIAQRAILYLADADSLEATVSLRLQKIVNGNDAFHTLREKAGQIRNAQANGRDKKYQRCEDRLHISCGTAYFKWREYPVRVTF
jgi:hypothetical protein